MPVRDRGLAQTPAQVHRVSIHLAWKVHEPDVVALHLHTEVIELAHESLDGAGGRLDVALKTVDLNGVRRRSGRQHVERLHELLPAGIMVNDVLDDTSDE